MKAAVLYGDGDLRYADWPDPRPGREEVVVRVAASGICGSDVPRVLRGGAHFYPIVLGHEFSGKVVETGPGVTRLHVGDRIAGVPLVPCMSCAACDKGDYSLCRDYSFIGSRRQGSFAEYVALPERNAILIADNVTFEQAALFEPSTVALHGLLHSGFRGGGDAAVVGGGTVGLFAAQWARLLGARRVVVCDLDENRLALAKRCGVDGTVNTAGSDFAGRAEALTKGRGFSRIFEAAGSPEALRLAFRLAADHAQICCIGTPGREVVFSAEEWEQMNRREFTVTGSWMSYSAPFPGREWEMTADYLARGKLVIDRGMIFRRFSLSDAAQAFGLYRTPGLVKGKILLCSEKRVG